MKYFAPIVFISFFWLCPLYGYSQDRHVVIGKDSLNFGQLIAEIEAQTDYLFLYEDMNVNLLQAVWVNEKNKTVADILGEVLKKMDMAYKFSNNYISLYSIRKKNVIFEDRDQNSMAGIKVSGLVVDECGDPLIGANILLRDRSVVGTVTDISGNFSIEVPANSHLVVSCIGYRNKVIKVNDTGTKWVRVALDIDLQLLDEVVVVGYGIQQKLSLVGAVSSIRGNDLRTGGVSSVSNNLTGRTSGLIGSQRSGEPGSDVTQFWIRGISTFGANNGALIMIDGVDRGNMSLNELVPEDIENFSILKDATATAVYGANGANGVVLINTKRGHEEKATVNVNVKTMLETLPRLPEYLHAYDYALLANEARSVRGNKSLYSPEIFEIIKYRMDPDMYPDVNWRNEILKKKTMGMLTNINVTGGSRLMRYYMSGTYRTNDAIYKQTGLKYYHSNVKRNQYTFRSNIDARMTNSTLVSLLLSAKFVNQNRPGLGTTDQIWSAQANLTPMTVPVRYSNGQFPAYGKDDLTSPSVLLNETGYIKDRNNTIESQVEVEQKLDFLLKGLKMTATIAFDKFNSDRISYIKMPDLYKMVDRDWNTGELMTVKTVVAQPPESSTVFYEDLQLYVEGKIEYNLVAAKKHRIGGLLLYNQKDFRSTDTDDALSSLPRREQGVAGRITYSFNDTYFMEGNFGYTGSENFPRGKRFGFFPSGALGVMVSNFPLIKKRIPFLSMLKLRYSYGLTGNDRISGDTRFPYLSTINMDAPGYVFGDLHNSGGGGVMEEITGSKNLVWEKSIKQNIGVDITLWNALDITIDAFTDYREDIFMPRAALPGTLGISSKPWGNVGKMKSWGSDGTISFTHRFGSVDLELRANYTFADNEIIAYDEIPVRYPYLSQKGSSYAVSRGLIALGLFKNEEDVRNSPAQFGTVLPGDIKYQDVNGDGHVDDDDMVPIGDSDIPKLQYGFAGTLQWKGFDFNIFFRGAGKVAFFMGGSGFYPFEGGVTGNVLSIVKQPENRWTPASYSGDPSTENPDAPFPRLTYGENLNNNRPSTFWLANGSYLRLKTMEIGYTFPKRVLNKIGINNFRISLTGDNLHVWDHVRMWDPEQASSNGAVYPLTRSYSLGLQVVF